MRPYRLIILTFLLCIFTTKVISQIGIGTLVPHPSSIVDISSTTKGFLPPRMNSLQRDQISNPAEGLMIYNNELSCLEYYTGDYWFNFCCNKTVNEGLSSIPMELYFNLNADNSTEKYDPNTGSSSGTPAVNGEMIYSYQSLVNNNTRKLEFSAGDLEPNSVFELQLENNPNLPPYKKRKSIYRTENRNLIGYNGPIAVSSLQYDFTPDQHGEFELFLIARLDSNADNIVPYSSFFSSSDGVVDNSLQLGLGSPSFNADYVSGIACETNYFRLFYKNGSENRAICGNTNESRIAVNDGQFHTFNIIQRDHPNGINKILELHIDGNLIQTDSSLTEYVGFEKLKIFSNRKGDKAMKGHISDLLFFTSPLTTKNNALLNEYLICKYGR